MLYKFLTRLIIPLALILLVQIYSCSGGSGNGQSNSGNSSELTGSKELQNGQDIYKRYCLSCHQAKGNGVPGMYPPLAGNPQLAVSKDSLIVTILRGKAGQVVVNGTTYAGIMAPHNFLSNEQVANVLNYVLKGMNKSDLSVSAEEVNSVRQKLK